MVPSSLQLGNLPLFGYKWKQWLILAPCVPQLCPVPFAHITFGWRVKPPNVGPRWSAFKTVPRGPKCAGAEALKLPCPSSVFHHKPPRTQDNLEFGTLSQVIT